MAEAKTLQLDITLSCVPPEQIEDSWPALLPHIEKSVNETSLHELLTTEHLKQGALKGEVDVLVFWKNETVYGVLILSVEQWPLSKVCQIFTAGACIEGEIDWIKALHTVEEYAKVYKDCDRLQINGRLGWTKVLKGWGFDEAGCTLTKSI